MNDDPVKIDLEGDQWVVRFVEDGISIDRPFDIKQHAEAWASGQRVRLLRNVVPDIETSLLQTAL